MQVLALNCKVLDRISVRVLPFSMPNPRNQRPAEPATPIHERALDDLSFIRRTMERAGSFTALSGWGQICVGVTGLLAAGLAWRQASIGGWLITWIVAAEVGLAIGLLSTARKARASGESIRSGPGRQFVLSLAPALLAGAVLTAIIWRTGMTALLPGIWLLLYGVGIIAAGSHSVRVVPLMGAVMMLLGAGSLISPPAWADAWLALGFGVVHIVFGFIIARKYGG
jgi:hypothetical protein